MVIVWTSSLDWYKAEATHQYLLVDGSCLMAFPIPAIRTRGAYRVATELSALRYDLRWGTLSAFDVGAPHRRERWFLLAHRNGNGCEVLPQLDGEEPKSPGPFWNDAHRLRDAVPNSDGNGLRDGSERSEEGKSKANHLPQYDGTSKPVADSGLAGLEILGEQSARKEFETAQRGSSVGDVESLRRRQRRASHEIFRRTKAASSASWWATEPGLVRVVNGLPQRVDRIRGLGNAVVPLQAREAFERLMGL